MEEKKEEEDDDEDMKEHVRLKEKERERERDSQWAREREREVKQASKLGAHLKWFVESSWTIETGRAFGIEKKNPALLHCKSVKKTSQVLGTNRSVISTGPLEIYGLQWFSGWKKKRREKKNKKAS